VGVLTQVQILGAPPPKNLGGQKTCKNRCDLRQLSNLSTNISGTDEDSDNM